MKRYFYLFIFNILILIQKNKSAGIDANNKTVFHEDQKITGIVDNNNGRVKREEFVNPYRLGKELGIQMSGTLDDLLGANYDKRIRPGFGNRPVNVELNMSIRSMGPVDERTQAYFLDCYFRQSWKDERLVYNTSGVKELSLDWKILNMIWKPDTIFANGKKSKLHKITVPNRFSRIAPDGRVSYSQRLTIHATCKMNLKKYPLDSQVCPLVIASYGYSSEDLIFNWKKKPISMDQLGLAQFQLLNWEAGTLINTTNRKLETGFRNDSVAYLKFYFERQTGFFLVQYYTPLVLMVLCSWVSFWIIRTDVPARCGLGVTTLLSVTKLGFGLGGKPQVPYATSLDIFVIICFFNIFASLIEFAIMNFITVFMTRFKANEKLIQAKLEEDRLKEQKSAEEEDKPHENGVVEKIFIPCLVKGELSNAKSPIAAEEDDDGGFRVIDEDGDDEFLEDVEEENEEKSREKVIEERIKFHLKMAAFWSDFRNRIVFYIAKFSPKPIQEMKMYRDTDELLDTFDEKARVYFPSVFAFMMTLYWSLYLYLLPDEFPSNSIDKMSGTDNF